MENCDIVIISYGDEERWAILWSTLGKAYTGTVEHTYPVELSVEEILKVWSRMDILVIMKDWQKAVLQKGRLYEVGGVVRDKLINPKLVVKDIDYLVTGISMDNLIRLLGNFGEVNLVGKSFGLIKFKPSGEDIVLDVALPREEYSVGVGHKDFVVKYDHNLNVEVDLMRRDFTMNAIAFDLLNGTYVNPLNGTEDIKRKLVRMINEKSFLDDPLRMLRAVQFAARFKFKLEEETVNAMKKHASLISNISAERIQEEFNKLLTKAKKPSIGLEIMSETGLLKIVIPELEAGKGVEQNVYHKYDVLRHNFYACDAAPRDNLMVRLAALFHDVGKVEKKRIIEDKKRGERVVFYKHEKESAKLARCILERLRFSGEVVEKVTHLIAVHMFEYTKKWTDSAVRRFMKRVGSENIEDLFLLRRADRIANGKTGMSQELKHLKKRIQAEVEKASVLDVKDLAVNGDDVMTILEISSGPGVGEVLDKLLELVLEKPSLNTREILIRKITEMRKREM